MTPRRKSLTTSLLLLLALATGAWKISGLTAANRELHRQNRACASSFAEIEETFRALRESSLKRGSPAAEFTLLGLDGAPLRFDPVGEQDPFHLLFLDPAGKSFLELLQNYAETLGSTQPQARALILTARGYEETRDALAKAGPIPYPVTVHASEVYRAYGFIESPGVAVVDGGILREKWRLPYRGDQLPID
jgi:hypothetical protein